MKSLQNLTSGFREEDFLRISSCLYSASSPHSADPCFLMDHNFTYNFSKGHPRNIPMKSFQNLTSDFQREEVLRNSSCLYSVSSPHSQTQIFEKGHPRNISDQQFQRRRFLKNCLENSIWFPGNHRF